MSINRRHILLISAVAALALSLFAVDLWLPLGVAVRLPYVAVVALSLWLPDRRYVYVTAAGCTLLALGGYFVTSDDGASWISLVNRLIGIFAFWIVAFVGLAARRTVELERANQALKQEMDRRQRLEAQLLRSQRLESIGILAGGIAHDFNNLMTPILMATKLLKEDRDADERRSLLSTLQASAERGAEIVRQLLAFAGGVDGQRKRVDITKLIGETKVIVSHTFPKAIQIELDVRADLKPIIADATQISQVLLNLCVNARDAMTSGGTLTIEARNATSDDIASRSLSESHAGPFVCVIVADTGIGIPAEALDKVFDPFFSTKGVGKGTGLGLATALGIIRAHGGSIDVESTVGRGSRFTILLPATNELNATHLETERSGSTRGRGETILIVDDEPFVLETAGTTLRDNGYRVMTATEGADAVDICRRHGNEIRAVVLDMMMPGLDGAATMAALEELDFRAPIIASSGLRLSGPIADSIARKHGAILPKPYTVEQMMKTVASVLQRGTNDENAPPPCRR